MIKGKRMKTALSKLMRNEKGQALPIVLVLLLIGSLFTAPLLGYMGTGLIAGQVFEERMEELYAADAGVEDAMFEILNDDLSLPQNLGESWTYSLADINGKDVGVDIVLEANVVSFLEDLLGEDSGPHDEWTVLEELVGAGTYEMTITYSGAASVKRINGVGAWVQGDYDYVLGSSSNMTDDYPVHDFSEVSFRGGTAFIWEWQGGNRPVFGSVSGVYTRSMTFEFTPIEIPELYFSWLVGGSMDIGVVPGSQEFEVYKVTATATDNTTGKQTEVVAYVSRQGAAAPYPVSILVWEIGL